MILITSAQYVDEEFASEFGKLPPSFLPVGNKRLYEHQAELFANLNESAYISLPYGFTIPYQDQVRLKKLNLQPIFIPTDKTLGESIAYALINILGDYEEVRILHGDTLFDKLPLTESNNFAIGNSSENYNWATFSRDKQGKIQFFPVPDDGIDLDIISGYFSFSHPVGFLRALSCCNGDFLSALNQYSEEFDLAPWLVNSWLDFGHMNTYHRSKSTITTQRAFNEMNISSTVVSKSSTNNFKMESEMKWYEGIPPELKIYTPHYLRKTQGNDCSGYDIEYLYLPVLNELFVFGELPLRTWKTILAACEQFMLIAADYPPITPPKIQTLYDQKLRQRLSTYCERQKIDPHYIWTLNGKEISSLNAISRTCLDIINKTAPRLSVVHGDFCFSNILYDFKLQSIRCIDPRGHVDDEITIYGDGRYDVAKLCHSIIGGYDHIIAGNFYWESDLDYDVKFELFINPVAERIENYMLENGFAGFDLIKDGIYAIMITLFLSMLPLHNDKPQRQKAFLANALRLYTKLDEIK